MATDTYVLGTGLSHNGSAVLLKNGQVCVAIEKERLSRIKHDGGNDTLAIQYCLDTEGITLENLAVIVQCANFAIPEREEFGGRRIFARCEQPPLINISHHLAHAYSAIGNAPFTECAVMVIDGCGSFLHHYLEIHPEQKPFIPSSILEQVQLQAEKDSFYYFDGDKLQPVWKDFSVMSAPTGSPLDLPTTKHSIGGFYSAISHYIFGDMNDVGKLMGLAPFGNSGVYKFDAFEFDDSSSLLVKEEWKNHFTNPSSDYEYFKSHFSYYADVAKWAQEQVEQAVLQCIQYRLAKFPHKNFCYAGGVALNAAANAKLLEKGLADNVYFEPAAADNGLALGCAYYGWLEYLKQARVKHTGSTCFGKSYGPAAIQKAIDQYSDNKYEQQHYLSEDELLRYVAGQLNNNKTVAWFHAGSEFGPRSLGRRSILAHPGQAQLKDHINKNIKFREDFRPFAPAVLKDQAAQYFVAGRDSPYMIVLDQTRPEYLDQLQNVTHYDGTARVQTVDGTWNKRFFKLLTEFHRQSGIPVLLNTSMNKKGTPMVETPAEALQLFRETALDILVLENTVLTKNSPPDNEQLLERILMFLAEIGIAVIEENLDDECILPGLKIQENTLRLDRKRLKYVGDLLHEAGHLAVTPEDQRSLIGTAAMSSDWPSDGDEITAILWSYAAVVHIGIPVEVVFHSGGYKNESSWIVDQFTNGNYLGLPLLVYMGFLGEQDTSHEREPTSFPKMVKWLR